MSGAATDRFSLIILVLLTLYSLLVCFMGYKLLKVWCAIIGGFFGALIGYFLSSNIFDNGYIQLAITLIVAALIAFFAYRIFKVGVFLISFFCMLFMAMSIFYVFTEKVSLWMWIVSSVLGVGLGIVCVRYLRYILIFFTSISSGFSAGLNIINLFQLQTKGYVPFAIGLVLSVSGIIIQLITTKGDESLLKPEESSDRVRKEKRKFAGLGRFKKDNIEDSDEDEYEQTEYKSFDESTGKYGSYDDDSDNEDREDTYSSDKHSYSSGDSDYSSSYSSKDSDYSSSYSSKDSDYSSYSSNNSDYSSSYSSYSSEDSESDDDYYKKSDTYSGYGSSYNSSDYEDDDKNSGSGYGSSYKSSDTYNDDEEDETFESYKSKGGFSGYGSYDNDKKTSDRESDSSKSSYGGKKYYSGKNSYGKYESENSTSGRTLNDDDDDAE